MDPFDLIGQRLENFSSIYDDDGPSSTVQESRPMFNNGGMLVQPSNDGSRPGYRKPRGPKTIESFSPEIQKRIKDYGVKKLSLIHI